MLEDTHRPDAFHLEPFSWQCRKPPNESADVPSLPALRRFRSPAPASFSRQKPSPSFFERNIAGCSRAGRPYRALGRLVGSTKLGADGVGSWNWKTGHFAELSSNVDRSWEVDGIYD